MCNPTNWVFWTFLKLTDDFASYNVQFSSSYSHACKYRFLGGDLVQNIWIRFSSGMWIIVIYLWTPRLYFPNVVSVDEGGTINFICNKMYRKISQSSRSFLFPTLLVKWFWSGFSGVFSNFRRVEFMESPPLFVCANLSVILLISLQ